ncbi:MAG: hypothetical protein HZC03_01145 [Candidatus Lloydbacteria bacterium]|nr:hypothetical protein [Candidatus Lloydbacteria bacterium]
MQKYITAGIMLAVFVALPFAASAAVTVNRVLTDPVSNISHNSAQLNGYADVSSGTNSFESAEVWFDWGISGTGVFDRTTSKRSTYNSARSFDERIYDLSPNTSYNVRFVARTSSGTSYGATVSFSTLVSPDRASVNTASPQNIDGDGALLNGYVNPRGSRDTVAWFEWGKTVPFTNTTPSMTLGSDSGTISFPLNSLEENTRYYYRIVATNSAGMSYGSTIDFKTTAIKESVSRGAPSVTTTGAEQEGGGVIVVLKGYVDTKNVKTRTWFEYGETTSLGRTTARSDERTDSGSFSETLSNLGQGIIYYYRAVVSNDNGVSYGNILSVTPGGASAAPVVVAFAPASAASLSSSALYTTTDQAESINEESALVRGNVVSADNRIVSQVWFEWGKTSALGNTTPLKNIGMVANVGVSESLFSLSSATRYYYRFAAKQGETTSYGAIETFTTGSSRALLPTAQSASNTGQSSKESNGRALAAAAFFGDVRAFMPATLIEWFLLAVLAVSFIAVWWRQRYV